MMKFTAFDTIGRRIIFFGITCTILTLDYLAFGLRLNDYETCDIPNAIRLKMSFC